MIDNMEKGSALTEFDSASTFNSSSATSIFGTGSGV